MPTDGLFNTKALDSVACSHAHTEIVKLCVDKAADFDAAMRNHRDFEPMCKWVAGEIQLFRIRLTRLDEANDTEGMIDLLEELRKWDPVKEAPR